MTTSSFPFKSYDLVYYFLTKLISFQGVLYYGEPLIVGISCIGEFKVVLDKIFQPKCYYLA